MSQLVFHRQLKLGSVGRDVRAVKRGLAQAGYGALSGSVNPLFGPYAKKHLANFQREAFIPVSGVYGERTHKALIPYFDAYARQLYEQSSKKPAEPVDPKPPPAGSIQLPKTYTSTHPTGGLPGYPAIDVFGKPHAKVLAPEGGTVRRLSGRDPSQGGSPGGSYGYSMYLDTPSADYFLTHFASRTVSLGTRVAAGQELGTICDSAVSGKPGTSHIHMGKRRK